MTITDPYKTLRIREKWLALKRAEFQLRVTFQRIDYKYDVLKPGLEGIDEQLSQGELPDIHLEEDDL